jgi:1-aminocyclopropane-1-carboxylate deaminase
VHRLDRLTAELSGAAIWAKREDLNSGIAFGGNKTRKLEYLVAEAVAQGCDTLVSIGGVQSNHTRQVAAVAARAGLRCVLVQESWVDWPDAVYDKVGNILLLRLAGADVRLVKAGFGIGFKESWENAIAEIEAAGRAPVRHPRRRLRSSPRRPRLRRLGGGGGRAGDRARRVLRHRRRLLGHRINAGRDGGGLRPGGRARRQTTAGARRRRLCEAGRDPRPGAADRSPHRRSHRLQRELTTDDVELDERYHAGTYGIPDGTTLDAMRLAARTEGMITDPVYEGKSMAATIALVRSGEIAPDSTVLYAHLGGQPALNGYSALFS